MTQAVELPEARDFPTAVIASLSTGVLLCEFDKVHEAAEYLLGCPVWTHHFASKDFHRKMQRAITEQHPEMPTEIHGVNRDNYLVKLAEVEAKVGKVVTIRKGDGSADMHPLESWPEGKPVIVVFDDEIANDERV